jgi:branched-chain amino acid transport system substrate-binding protein
VNTVERVANSCDRQNYHPLFAELSTAVSVDMASNPALNGMIGTQPIFPWTENDTPATQEFHAAFQRFGANVPEGPANSQSWAAGQLLRKAVELSGSSDVTSQTILAGLWKIKDETLGGLTPPITFVQDAPAPTANCYFVMQANDGQWTTPQGGNTSCVPQ